MRVSKSVVKVICILGLVGLTSLAEARVGGGRSSGFRGSRGFSPRSSQPSFSGSGYGTGAGQSRGTFQQPSPSQPSWNGNYSSPQRSSGSFTRGLLGGLAGGFLGSMLFQNLGHGNALARGYGGGGGGIGILEILLLAGLGFWLFKRFTQERSNSIQRNSVPFEETPPSNQQAYQQTNKREDEKSFTQILQRYDTSFDLGQFKDQRMDDFLKIQSAWNTRDITPVQDLIAPELRSTLDYDINELKRLRQINKLENIAVRGSELTESWQEQGKEYATLRFRAQLLDYTIDENTQNLVAGDRTQPVKFEEEWTFVRDINEHARQPSWKLTAISN